MRRLDTAAVGTWIIREMIATAARALALDIGTSSVRASTYEARRNQRVGRACRMGYTARTTPDGGAELDADQLFAWVCGVIDSALQTVPRTTSLSAMGISSFWHSLLGLNSAGAPCTPLYLWMDARGAVQARDLRQQLDATAVHARTGCLIHPSYWPAKLLWIHQAQPRTRERVRHWVSFADYLLLRLCGELATSVSLASSTGLFVSETGGWDTDLLARVYAELRQLPPIVSEGNIMRLLSPYRERWPQLADTPVVPPFGDGATSNVGSGCLSPDRVGLTIGTSAVERVVCSAEKLTTPESLWSYRLDTRRAVVGGAMNDGGNLLQWLRHTIRGVAPDSTLAQMAPDTHGLTILPFWAGERSPGWHLDARGAMLGLRLHTTSVDVQRASLEAIALQLANVDASLAAILPADYQVVATGGALLRSPAWLQILADVLQRPIEASREQEASSKGAALLASEAVGLLERPLDQQRYEVERSSEPDPHTREAYRAAAERQQRAYAAMTSEAPG